MLMRKTVCALFLLLWAASSVYAQKNAGPFTLTIKSDKSVYKTGEPIYIEYEIFNNGDVLIAIDQPFSDDGIVDPAAFSGTFFIQRQEDDNSIEVFPLADISWPRLRSVEIAPHESYKKRINIIGMIEKPEEGELLYSTNLFLYKKGRYRIIGKFTPRLVRLSCWKEPFESSPIFITIEEKNYISQDEALRIAKRTCRQSKWPWQDTKILDKGDQFLVITNASHQNGHAEVYIDKKTGNVLNKFHRV